VQLTYFCAYDQPYTSIDGDAIRAVGISEMQCTSQLSQSPLVSDSRASHSLFGCLPSSGLRRLQCNELRG
jgi:hypothetical protein